MGADSSKEATKFAQVNIQTEKTDYLAGDTITGHIYLNVLENLESMQLFIKVKGVEAVHLLEQVPAQKKVTKNGVKTVENIFIDKLFEEKKEILKGKVLINDWQVLEAGHYAIPFAFVLPTHIQGSFYQRGTRYLANLSYVVQAHFEPMNKKAMQKIKSEQVIGVRRPIRNSAQGPSNEVTTKLKTCWCLDKGSNLLKVGFEKNTYCPGEIAQVLLELDNSKCALNNSTITLTLNQNLTLKTKDKTIEKKIVRVERILPGVQAKCTTSNYKTGLNLPSVKLEPYSKAKKYDFKTVFLETIQEMEQMGSTVAGDLIQSNFYLEVTAPMERCHTIIPTITLPINMYLPEHQKRVVNAPENWEPKTLDLVNVLLDTKMGVSVQREPSRKSMVPSQTSLNTTTELNSSQVE